MEEDEKGMPILHHAQRAKNTRENNSVIETKPPEHHIGTEENAEDGSFKRKLCIHAIICFSLFSVGWTYSMIGPSFPDLLKITGVSPGAGSVFVSANHAGMFVGCFLCGFFIDRYNQYLVMVFASFCFGSATVAYPMCALYWTMILVNCLQGFGCGMLLTGAFTKCGQLWTTGASSRSFMHSFQLCMPVGSILAPLLVSPFLSSDPSIDMSTNMSQRTSSMNVSSTSYTNFNDSAFSDSVLPDKVYRLNSSYVDENYTISTDKDTARDQQLIIPFSISAALILLLLLLLLGKFMEHPTLKAIETKRQRIQSTASEQKPSVSLTVRIVRLYLVGQLGFLEKGSINSFLQFFPVFLHRQMGWTKVLGSDIMSVFWGFFALSRLIGIAISYYIKPSTYLFFDILFFLVSMVVFLVGTYLELDVLMWVSAASIGIALSTFSPCLTSWSHSEILSRSGKHNSFLLLTNCIGSVVLPLLVGNLIEKDYLWLVYMLLTSSLLMLVNLVCLVVFARIKLRYNTGAEDIRVFNNDSEGTKMVD